MTCRLALTARCNMVCGSTVHHVLFRAQNLDPSNPVFLCSCVFSPVLLCWCVFSSVSVLMCIFTSFCAYVYFHLFLCWCLFSPVSVLMSIFTCFCADVYFHLFLCWCVFSPVLMCWCILSPVFVLMCIFTCFYAHVNLICTCFCAGVYFHHVCLHHSWRRTVNCHWVVVTSSMTAWQFTSCDLRDHQWTTLTVAWDDHHMAQCLAHPPIYIPVSVCVCV